MTRSWLPGTLAGAAGLQSLGHERHPGGGAEQGARKRNLERNARPGIGPGMQRGRERGNDAGARHGFLPRLTAEGMAAPRRQRHVYFFPEAAFSPARKAIP
jgi:hypothetical protein